MFCNLLHPDSLFLEHQLCLFFFINFWELYHRQICHFVDLLMRSFQIL